MKLKAALFATALPVLAAHSAAQAVELASHRAVYDLSLLKAQPSSGLASIEGRLVIEWRQSCDGSVSNQRLGFLASLDEGPGFSYDVSFSSWESADAMELRFNSSSYSSGELLEAVRGEAALNGPGNPGVVQFKEPDGQIQNLPAGTLFPTEHIKALIEAAHEGQFVTSHDVFDGSGPDALARVTAVIAQPGHVAVEGSGKMFWPVSLAYFTDQNPDGMPAFEISFDLADDGVLQNVRLDYGDFVIDGRMAEVEIFPSPACK